VYEENKRIASQNVRLLKRGELENLKMEINKMKVNQYPWNIKNELAEIGRLLE